MQVPVLKDRKVRGYTETHPPLTSLTPNLYGDGSNVSGPKGPGSPVSRGQPLDYHYFIVTVDAYDLLLSE